MTTISPTTDVVHVEPLLTDAERVALAGFLAGYRGRTRDAYALDLRHYASWCQGQGLRLFQARRANIECFGRDMEARGRARAHYRPPVVHGVRIPTATQSKRSCLSTPRPCTCADLAWTTSPTPSGWTATRLARYWSRPGSVPRTNTP